MSSNKYRQRCEVCGSCQLVPYPLSRRKLTLRSLSARQVQVTNKDYGVCLPMVKCQKCGLVQVAYRLQAKDILKLYAEMTDKAYLDSAEMRSWSNYLQIEPLLKHLPASARILEIGAGGGTVVNLLKTKGGYSRVTGVEPSQKFARFAQRQYGIQLINCGFENLRANRQYQVVLALDVIEHVVSPKQFMKKLNALLVRGGIGIISTPNLGSWLARLLGWRWWHVRPPHLYYFNSRNFALLAERWGLSVIDKRFFTWRLPFNYLVDSFQRLFFKRPIFSLPKGDRPINLNTFDSYLYVVQKH